MPDRPDDQPRRSSSYYTTRLQVLHLPAGPSDYPFALVFDQWEGPQFTALAREEIKKQTGAKAVLIFEGSVDIDC